MPRRRAALSTLDIEGTNSAYPGDNGNPGGSGPCDGIDEWVAGQSYSVGDQVTFRGFLFERDFTTWINKGSCNP